jgi:hypothetical protein
MKNMIKNTFLSIIALFLSITLLGVSTDDQTAIIIRPALFATEEFIVQAKPYKSINDIVIVINEYSSAGKKEKLTIPLNIFSQKRIQFLSREIFNSGACYEISAYYGTCDQRAIIDVHDVLELKKIKKNTHTNLSCIARITHRFTPREIIGCIGSTIVIATGVTIGGLVVYQHMKKQELQNNKSTQTGNGDEENINNKNRMPNNGNKIDDSGPIVKPIVPANLQKYTTMPSSGDPKDVRGIANQQFYATKYLDLQELNPLLAQYERYKKSVTEKAEDDAVWDVLRFHQIRLQTHLQDFKDLIRWEASSAPGDYESPSESIFKKNLRIKPFDKIIADYKTDGEHEKAALLEAEKNSLWSLMVEAWRKGDGKTTGPERLAAAKEGTGN